MSAVSLGIIEFYFYRNVLLNSSPHFIRLLSELLKLIGCRGNINDKTFLKTRI